MVKKKQQKTIKTQHGWEKKEAKVRSIWLNRLKTEDWRKKYKYTDKNMGMKQWRWDEWNEKRPERKFNNENQTLEVWRKERKN